MASNTQRKPTAILRADVVDARGGAILAEFASVVDAVNGAVEIQRNIISKRVLLGLPDYRGLG